MPSQNLVDESECSIYLDRDRAIDMVLNLGNLIVEASHSHARADEQDRYETVSLRHLHA
jgi:hypothetical protein